MQALSPGVAAPPVPGVEFADGPTALFFYKVTCPVCQMAAPKAEAFQRAYPGRIVGVGQDPEEKLGEFDAMYGMTFPRVADLPPYEVSEAYGIRVVPTVVLVGRDGVVLDSVESWDRDGLNGLSKRLADLTGAAYVPISDPADGLPPFRPG
ncbi:MAG: peroxiredoxin family protein [Actinomycetota bacterium]